MWAAGLAAALLAPTASKAQLAILGRTDSTEVIIRANVAGALEAAWAAARLKGGEWKELHNGTECGYYSVFAAADKNGRYERRYFVAVGAGTSAAAVNEAREAGRAYTRAYQDTPFVMSMGLSNRNLALKEHEHRCDIASTGVRG
jgi:hypothetical protein